MEGDLKECIVTLTLTNTDTIYYFDRLESVLVVLVQTGERVGSQFQYGTWFETKNALHHMPNIEQVFGVGVCG